MASAFALDVKHRGEVERLRLAYAGVAATPVRVLAAERAALGKTWNAATQEDVARELGAIDTPIDDKRGSAAYRRAMIVSLFRRFCADLAAREQNQASSP